MRAIVLTLALLSAPLQAEVRVWGAWCEIPCNHSASPDLADGGAFASTRSSLPVARLLLGEILFLGTDGGEFGGSVTRLDLHTGAWESHDTFPITGLAPDPSDASCLLVARRAARGQGGGIYRLCPDEGWEMTRVPGVIDLQNDEGGEQVPILALAGDGERAWAVSEGLLWTLVAGRWTSARLEDAPEVRVPGATILRSGGKVRIRPGP